MKYKTKQGRNRLIMTRLPQPGGDKGNWGDILNDFLSQSHNADGTLKPVSQANVTGLTTAIAVKANTADLSAVATSGSYADLSNKPTIPATAADIGSITSSEVDSKIAAQATSDMATYATLAAAATLWKANTAYATGQPVINPSGQVVTALAGFTSGASYDASKWSAPAAGGASIDDTTTSTSKAWSSSKVASAVFGYRTPGRRVAALGDSITAGVIGAATPDANNVIQGSYLMYGVMASLGRLEWGGQFGVPGEASAQILTRVNQVIAAKPDMCIVLAGTNDGDTSTLIPNLPQIINALTAAGIEPVMATLPPSSSATALNSAPHYFIRLANGWITKYATAHGIRLIDFFGALVDPATGKYKTGYNSDVTHPNQTGYRTMGQAVSDALSPEVKAGSSWLIQDMGDSTPFNGDGTFSTGTTAPTNWYVAAGSGTFVTDPFFAGRGYKFTRTDASTMAIEIDLGSASWTFEPGDLVAVSCKVKTTGLQASGGYATVSVPNNNKTSGPTNIVSWQVGADFPNGAVLYWEAVVPPGTNGMSVQLRIDGGNGAGDTVTFGQFAVRSLTKIGYTG